MSVRLSGEEAAELSRRAAVHGVSVAEYVRRAALKGSVAHTSAADQWWDEQTPERREQVHGWLTKRAEAPRVEGVPLPLDL